MTTAQRVQIVDERDGNQQQSAEERDRELERGIHTQWMCGRMNEAGKQEAAEAQATHERAEQDAQRERRRANDDLEELEPDDFVDQCRTAAANEQQDEPGEGGTTTAHVVEYIS